MSLLNGLKIVLVDEVDPTTIAYNCESVPARLRNHRLLSTDYRYLNKCQLDCTALCNTQLNNTSVKAAWAIT